MSVVAVGVVAAVVEEFLLLEEFNILFKCGVNIILMYRMEK